jgi:D-arabinose 1-dehydrogenase-like Zn-dependent alcohol dehydrogenase
MLAEAVDLAEKHDLHPYIADVYEWEDAPKAFERLREQEFIGKLVIKV